MAGISPLEIVLVMALVVLCLLWRREAPSPRSHGPLRGEYEPSDDGGIWWLVESAREWLVARLRRLIGR